MAAVGDEKDVHFVASVGRNGGFEQRVGFFGGNFRGDPMEAASDAVNVRVDREDGHLEGEEKEAGDGFGADAFEAAEVGCGLVGWEVFEEFEGDSAVVLAELLKDCLDAWCFEA